MRAAQREVRQGRVLESASGPRRLEPHPAVRDQRAAAARRRARGSTATSSPTPSETQPRNGSSAATGPAARASARACRPCRAARRCRAAGPTRRAGRSSAARRAPCELVEDRARRRRPPDGRGRPARPSVVLLPASLSPSSAHTPPSATNAPRVEALAPQPARGDQRHGRQVGMGERAVVDAAAAGGRRRGRARARSPTQPPLSKQELRAIGADAVGRRPRRVRQPGKSRAAATRAAPGQQPRGREAAEPKPVRTEGPRLSSQLAIRGVGVNPGGASAACLVVPPGRSRSMSDRFAAPRRL